MILSGPQILKEIERGNIVIEPFEPKNLNPNSYDLRLAPEILTYVPLIRGKPADGRWELDARADNRTYEYTIPDEGMVLEPGVLYLGHTLEYTETRGFVPCIESRSSAARLGLSTHLSAGWGDVGFKGTFTLEITVAHPLRVYPGMRLCQIAYTSILGELKPYEGKYQGQRTPQPSGLWKDFEAETASPGPGAGDKSSRKPRATAGPSTHGSTRITNTQA